MSPRDTCSFAVDPTQVPDGGVGTDGVVSPTDVLEEPWDCPHEAHADAEYCLFHLPVEHRRERDISATDVSQAFLERVTSSGQEPKEFVGARFRTLDLRYRTIDVDDRYPIDLRGAHIETLHLGDSAVGQPVSAAGVTIDDCTIEGATLRGDWTLDRARFTGPATFRESSFDGDLFLADAVFEAPVEFVETRINGEASFARTRFGDHADFQECEWHLDVSFCDGTFAQRAVFDGAEFHGGANVLTDDADFSGTEFAGATSFSKAQFRFANFTEASFAAAVTFDGATFARGGEFEGAVFDGKTTFDRVSVEGDATFAAAEFADSVRFQESSFEGDAVFRDAEFLGPVKLAGTTFDGGSRLLEDDADFSGARFASELDCHHAEFRYAEFEACEFADDVNFRRTEYDRGAAFSEAVFTGDADFYRSRFEGEVAFTDCRFDHLARFDETVFDDDVAFDGIEMRGGVRFHGAEFHGGAKEVDDADFAAATFHDRAEFDEATFGYASFASATFTDGGSFDKCEFDRGVSFDGADAAGTLSFEQTFFDDQSVFTDMAVADIEFAEAVFNHDTVFDRAEVAGAANFHGVEFNGGTKRVDDAGFEETVFRGPVDFGDVEFRYANFSEATFGDELSLLDAQFTAGATFDRATIEGTFDCLKARFDEETSFEGAHAVAPVSFDESVFDSDVSFAQFQADEAVTFRGTEFKGGANDRIDDAKFAGARFGGPTDFSTAQFRRGNFADATFEAAAVFESVRFVLGISFDGTRIADRLDCTNGYFSGAVHFEPEALDDIAVVDLTSATIEDGRIVETGPVYYDMTEAKIGDIRLEQTEPSVNVFDRILFLNTNFDGFDFSLHRDYLTQNEWRIHDVVFEGDRDLAQFDLVAEPDQLETTYLKARNSAQSTGDNKAASEFFILEYVYRRRQYTEIIADRGLGDPLATARAGWRWFTNFFFDVTCGFGERPSKVVVASTAVVVLYGLLYWFLELDVPGGGFAAILVYSFQGFTSLVLGAPQGSTPLTNLATATEGFAGAFFIALFVFALTRSMNR